MIRTIKQIKNIVISIIGFIVLLIGLLLIILPGPALIVIPLGLGILATQFAWARNLLKKITEQAKRVKTELKNKVGHTGKPNCEG